MSNRVFAKVFRSLPVSLGTGLQAVLGYDRFWTQCLGFGALGFFASGLRSVDGFRCQNMSFGHSMV